MMLRLGRFREQAADRQVEPPSGLKERKAENRPPESVRSPLHSISGRVLQSVNRWGLRCRIGIRQSGDRLKAVLGHHEPFVA